MKYSWNEELLKTNVSLLSEENTKLKQERYELAAQVEVMRDALLAYQRAGYGNSTDFRLQGDAYDASVIALSITGPEALREVKARTLSQCGLKLLAHGNGSAAAFLECEAAAIRKGE